MAIITTALIAALFMGPSSAPPKPQPASTTTTEVPFRLAETAIIVDATVNGKGVSLLFDSGYGGAVIVDDTVNLGTPTGTQGLVDFVGTMEAPTVRLKTLKIGAKQVKTTTDMDAVLIPGQRLSSVGYNMHMDGILGFEAVSSEVTEINFQKKMFIFHPKSYDISKKVPDNKTTFLLKMLPIGHSAVVLDAVAPGGKKLYLTLDTGNSFFATTHKESLQRVGLWDATRKPKFTKQSGVATGSVDSWTKKMSDMIIFGVPVKTSYWDVIDLPGSSADSDGTVGFGFLSNFNVTIDYERRRVWLENFTGKAGNDEPGDVGIGAAVDSERKRVRVYSVAPESPADKAGIKKGDDILAIDGKDVPSNIGWREFRRMLEGAPDSKMKMDLSRDGQLIRVELTRARLAND